MEELKNKIFQEIEENKLKPKPKWLFAFKSLGLLLFILFIILFSFYVLAFVGFILSERDWIQESTYSLQGAYFLLNTLPISMIFLAMSMILVASVTAYKYGLSYRKPFVYTLIVVSLTLLGGRYLFYKSGLQEYIKEEAFKTHIQLVPDSWKELRNDVKSAQMK
jgi:hypothetical protein